MKCSGYSAIVEEDESKYYLIEKINKILIFWYCFELQCTATTVEEDESKYYLIEKINKILIFWYSFELQCTAIFGCAL